MEFEWGTTLVDLSQATSREMEEAFEDPFSIRLLPDFDEASAPEARYFILGKTSSGRGLFIVFWTDGKRYRVVQGRPMSELEVNFYDRKNADLQG